MAQTETSVLTEFRTKLLERGMHSIKAIGRTFRIIDDDGSRSLTLEELKEGLTDCGLNFAPSDVQTIFNNFDKDGSGSISFHELLVGLRGNLNESRRKIVSEAFKKADRSGDGVVTAIDLKQVYNCREHPKYMNGEWTEQQVFDEFLKTFEPDANKRDGQVTQEEFMDYYAAVSASIDNDAYFDLMMRNAWKI